MTRARRAGRRNPRLLALASALALQGCAPEGRLGRWIAPDASTGDAAGLVADPQRDAETFADTAVAAPCSAPGSDADACAPADDPFVSEELIVTPGVALSYFAGGDALPAGDYSLAYVDGCWKSSIVNWTVNHDLEGGGYWLAGGDPWTPIGMVPGTQGTFAGAGAYSFYDECVAANQQVPALTFAFQGGPLAISLDSADEALYFMMLMGGTTFRLSCVGLCR
jgi:hypothetical protein